MGKDRISVPVHLSEDEIMLLRDLVMKSDLDINTQHKLTTPLAQGLLHFGSPLYENRVKCADAEEKNCGNCRHVCIGDDGNYKTETCPKWEPKEGAEA